MMKKNISTVGLFLKFLKIGLFTFGGGYAMIGWIKKEFSKKIDLRYTPKLKFKFDYERKKSFEIDRLINGLLPKS